MADREFLLRIVGDSTGAQKALGDVEKKSSGFATAFKGAAAAIAASAVVDKVVQFGTAAVNSASDLEQSLGGSQQIFGKYAGNIEKFSKTTAENMGISQGKFLEMSNVTGSLLKNTGMPLKEVTGNTKALTERAADMAAMFGGDVDQALGAINSALKGEMDPLENFGVSLKASAVNAKAVSMGLVDAEGKATDYGKSQAAIALIMEQSADSAGTFARESDTLAGRQAIMSARWQDMQTQLGTKLLPIINKVAGFLLDTMIPALSKVATWIQVNWPPIYEEYIKPVMENIQIIIKAVLDAVGLIWKHFGKNIMDQVKNFMKFIGGHIKAGMKVISGIFDVIIGLLTGDWKRAWNGAKKIVTGIIDNFVNQFKYLYRTGRNILSAIWHIIADPVKKGYQAARTVLGNMLDFIRDIPGRIGRLLASIWREFTAPFREGVAATKTVVQNVVDWFRGFPDRIGNAVRAIWRTLSQPFKDAISAIKDVANGILTWFGEFPDRIGSAIGDVVDIITSPFESAFGAIQDLWNNTVGGFGFSIPSWVPGVGGKSFEIPSMATGGIISRPTIALLGEAGPEAVIPLGKGGLATGSVVINVYALTANAEVGRKVYEALREYERTTGRVA